MTKSPKEAAAAAEEIRVLQEQMKEMQRRLDALCAEQPAEVSNVEDDDEPPVQEVESVSGPDEANAASGASSQDAYSVSEQAAYQPPANPVSGYAAQQTQPFVSGAPVPPPSYGAAAQQATQQQQAYYGHPTGRQAYQSGGASYSSGYGSSAQTPYNLYGQTVYQQPVVRTKDHVAAGLLGIFLGSLGVHKFYLGYNTAGFIMLGVAILGGLLSFGIATSIVWLIGLIEGIIYLVKNQAEFEQAYVFSKREWF